MPRRKSNARTGQKKKKMRAEIYLIPFEHKDAEKMSPGKLVAVAEYKVVEGY
jgi:hypothetical protein